MVLLKTLLKERNTKSRYDLIMDVIGEFIELKDEMGVRMLKIEELLNTLKPELDDERHIIPPEDFPDDDHLSKEEDDDDESNKNKIHRTWDI